MGIVATTRFHHTLNSNHLNQNIGLNKHKLSLLVKHNTAECNVSQAKRIYHATIDDGALRIKEAICDSAVGMKSRFLRLLSWNKRRIAQVIDLFEATPSRANFIAAVAFSRVWD